MLYNVHKRTDTLKDYIITHQPNESVPNKVLLKKFKKRVKIEGAISSRHGMRYKIAWIQS